MGWGQQRDTEKKRGKKREDQLEEGIGARAEVGDGEQDTSKVQRPPTAFPAALEPPFGPSRSLPRSPPPTHLKISEHKKASAMIGFSIPPSLRRRRRPQLQTLLLP